MPAPSERKPQTVTGRAALETVRRGTAGEHVAVVLRTRTLGRLILQRRGGNPFQDRQTRRLVGHKVRLIGFRFGNVFRYVTSTLLDT